VTTVIAGVVDATIITALGLLVCAALRRKPAALRHMILAASLAAAATAPVLEIMLPNWELPVLSSSAQVTEAGSAFSDVDAQARAAVATEIQQAPALSWTAAFVAMWAIGFTVVMGGLLAGLARLVALTRRCRRVASGAWRERADVLSTQHALTRAVVVFESPDRALLLTWGLWRPRIIVPAGVRSWAAERIEVVLAHEMAHVARRDWAVQIAAETVRAIYWFNPLIWIACRRLRDESEQACDDTVLRHGIDAADYASHLLAVARQVLTADRGWASAPAVANGSTLERRIAAMLNASRNREPLTRPARVGALLAMLAVTIPLTSVTLTERVAAATIAPAVPHDVALVAPEPAPSAQTPPPVAARSVPLAATPRPAAAPAQQPTATFSGVVSDATGAVMPGVAVTLTDTASEMAYSTVSDSSGAFVLRNLPPSRYQLKASLPGFTTLTADVLLGIGAELETKLAMRVGQLSETVSVTCPAGPAALAPRAAATVMAFDGRRPATQLFAQQVVPIRVGGQIAVPRPIRKVQPGCPGNLPANGYVVILEGTMGVDGLIKDIRVLRPNPFDPLDAIAQSALDVVRQWEYTPARLNNVPIPVIVTVTVSYARQ
jgi:beta-lactamase regulating signal transducer with metallopeptidase domain